MSKRHRGAFQGDQNNPKRQKTHEEAQPGGVADAVAQPGDVADAVAQPDEQMDVVAQPGEEAQPDDLYAASTEITTQVEEEPKVGKLILVRETSVVLPGQSLEYPQSPPQSQEADEVMRDEEEGEEEEKKSSPKKVSKKDKEKFERAWKSYLDKNPEFVRVKKSKTQERRQDAILGSFSDERDLARLGWILVALKPVRVCCAVMIAGGELTIFVNNSDAQLSENVEALKVLAGNTDYQNQEQYQTILGRVKQGAKNIVVANPKTKERAEDRLQKAIVFLGRYLNTGTGLKVHENVIAGKHAEMRLGDALVAAVRAQKRDKPLQVFVGISKLCCAKCYLALGALKAGYDIDLLVQGGHFKVYEGWPIPKFLKDGRKEAALKAFLGDEAYKLFEQNPDGYWDIIEAYTAGGGTQQTGYASSEDEEEGEKGEDEETTG